ncbi:hypothetical protein [Cereibacter sphaeroides]|uniref:hypothetical protein n=1 Tax=Cereibacter sphaeroides TaxID=1063 RepID=UPI001F3C05E4|nr:hypothetical protein [Cereibacter sphaeroides]MCE6949658.1 hypothetical protein [Cereibacter sphaeroides]MCE6967191.1 hypothetical protein [Cereibacter sphaeroides]
MARLPNDHLEDPFWAVTLQSPGGDLMEGMRLGEAFREAIVVTNVRREQTCASACALAFLGGTFAYTVSLGVFRQIEPGAHLGYHGFSVDQDQAGLVSATLEQARQANAVIRDYAMRMGVKDIGLLLGLFNSLEIEEIDTPHEIEAMDISLAGDPPKPPRGWAVNACRQTVSEMLHSLDPVGLEERVPGDMQPMKSLEHFRQTFLDAKFPAGDLSDWNDLRRSLMKMEPDLVVDLLAGRQLFADRSPIGIWEVWLDRGASFYYDVCFGISDFQSITTVVVSSDGEAITRDYNTLAGFLPNQPLW